MTAATVSVTVREATYVDPRAGNDKFYRVYVSGNQWFSQYGRNGTIGTFTKVVDATDAAAATKAADAKFGSKLKKGYAPSRSGVVTVTDLGDIGSLDSAVDTLRTGVADNAATPPPVAAVATSVAAELPDRTVEVAAALDAILPAHTAVSADLPMRPMLASVQAADVVAAAMRSPEWVTQFKYDGDRTVVDVNGGQLRVLNRQGQTKVRNVGSAHLAPFTALRSGRWVFDGEIVGRTLVLFDLAAAADGARTWVADSTPFADRYAALVAIAATLGVNVGGSPTADAHPVVVAPVADGPNKAIMLSTAVAEQREGIILRHRSGPYEMGRRTPRLVKHKLVKDADVVVVALHPAKESATLAVHNTDGELVEVGSASTIGKGDVAVGEVWVVTFLYVTDPRFPRMVQPRLVSRRDDKTADECLMDQFADAGTNKAI